MRFVRKRYLMILLISYISILIIPLLTGGLAYLISKKAVEDEVFRANSAILQQARNYIDEQLEQKELLVAGAALNPRVNDFLRVRSPISETERYRLYNMARDLSSYKNMYPFISDFYIYFQNSDMIITPSAIYTPSMFYKYMYSYTDMDYNEWKTTILEGFHNNTFIPPQIMSNPSSGRYITYIRSLPISLNQHTYANLVILIDEQKIRSLLGDLEWLSNGSLYIVDNNGNIIISNNYEDSFNKLPVTHLEGEEGYSLISTDKGNMALSYISSKKQGWKYVSLMPTEVFMARVSYIKRITSYIFLVSLSVGLVLACLQTYRNYLPINKIIGILSAQNYNKSEQKFTEFDYIQKAITYTIEEDKRIQQLLDEQKPMVSNNLILRFLEGKVDFSQSWTDSFETFGISFPYDFFTVLVIGLDEQHILVEKHFEEQWTLFRVAISDYVLKTSSWKDIKAYIAEVDRGRIAFLLNVGNENINDLIKNLNTSLEELKKFIADSFELFCTLGIGSIHKSASGISKSYSEANRALDYRILKGYGSIIWYSDIVESDQSYFYPIETEQQMSNCLKAGELDKAQKVFNYIFEENLKRRHLSPDMLKFLFSDMVGTLVKVINELKLDYKMIFHINFDPVTCLADCFTTNDISDKFHMIFERLCTYINENKKSHNTFLIERITSYIQREYKNSELCLQMIANAFHISVPYLSRFFKEQTGANLNSYINTLRIEMARELLNDQIITISEIAKQVGFSNDTSFIRVFKKITGITPGSYRQSSVEGE